MHIISGIPACIPISWLLYVFVIQYTEENVLDFTSGGRDGNLLVH